VGDLLYRRNDRALPLFSCLALSVLCHIPPRWDGMMLTILCATSLECMYEISDRLCGFASTHACWWDFGIRESGRKG
jgi:hypothetical protein